MTNIKRTKPKIIIPSTPRCEWICRGYGPDLPSVARNGDKQCALGSSYEIEGHHFCGTHAGKVALRILMKEDYTADVVCTRK